MAYGEVQNRSAIGSANHDCLVCETNKSSRKRGCHSCAITGKVSYCYSGKTRSKLLLTGVSYCKLTAKVTAK